MVDVLEDRYTPSSYEILHSGRYDLVLNLEGTNVQEIRSLANQFRNGIPATWHKEPRKKSYELGRVNVYLDDPQNPQYLVKVRERLLVGNDLVSRASFLKQARESGINETKRYRYALNSLLSEMNLAPKLTRLLSTKEATAIVDNFGFSSIEFVPPLVGLLDKKTGQRTVLYKFVSGAGDIFDDQLMEDRLGGLSRATKLVDQLTSYLRQHNIEPRDFHSDQFIIGYDNQAGEKLYLIDAEGFYSS